jgi:hypothetical protein
MVILVLSQFLLLSFISNLAVAHDLVSTSERESELRGQHLSSESLKVEAEFMAQNMQFDVVSFHTNT